MPEFKKTRRGKRDFLLPPDGSEIFRDYYKPPQPDAAPFYTWYMRCPRHGKLCQRRREVRPASTQLFGEFECIAYLECCKRSCGAPDRAATHSHRAKDDEVTAWMAANGERCKAENKEVLELCVLAMYV